jgi:hypothetical protein
MIDSSTVEASRVRPNVLEIDLLGTRLRTLVDDRVLAQHLGRLFEGVRSSPTSQDAETFEVVGGGPGGDWVLRRNGRGIYQTKSRLRLIEHYLSLLNEVALDSFPGISVHSGVVAEGRSAIAFPGESGVGKSTLVAACIAAGLDYVSDEALCLDPQTSWIVPYPRPLMLTSRSRRVLASGHAALLDAPGKVAVSPADLGGRTSSGQLNLAHVIVPLRGVPLSLEQIPTAEALPVLLERCFNRLPDPAMAFDVLGGATERCRAWRLGYDDAIEAAALVRRGIGFSRLAR